jgi:hypothetical protein
MSLGASKPNRISKLYCWTISPRGYHRSSNQCFYHRVDNSSYWWTISSRGVINPVIETLTTGWMIPSGTNSPPVARVINPVKETLTTGPMISS